MTPAGQSLMPASHPLAALARHLGVPRLSPNAEGACAVILEDGLTLDLQILQACDELRLTLPLGQPDPARRDALLAEALLANTLLASHSSRHLAWEPETGQLVMCQTLDLEPVVPAALERDVDDFITAGRTLRQQLQQAGVFQPCPSEGSIS